MMMMMIKQTNKGGEYHFCVTIHHFRVFYLETSAPELKIASNFMDSGFKFAEIEYFNREEAALVAPVKPKHAKRSCGSLHFPIVFP